MNKLTVTDVRIVPGDSGFLIDDGETALLYDTGFGFTADAMAQKIKALLGQRPLDYILLTHSHYDHALGSAGIKSHYPTAKVVAGEYACKIFAKPTAQKTMGELDRKAAKRWGITQYEDRTRELSVDIPVKDGDTLTCGTVSVQVMALPGHTRCSVGYYLPEHHLLLGTETLGVRFPDGRCLPSCLVGYEMTLEAFEKVKIRSPQKLLIPHYGVIHDVQNYLDHARQVTVDQAQTILTLLSQGKTREEILQYLTQTLYTPAVQPVYPKDAFLLNTGIMIDLISKECK